MTDANAESSDLGALPEWDLTDLYPAPDSAELAADLTHVDGEAKAFRKRYKDKLSGLDGAAFGAAIAEYEAIDETMGRVMSYAHLVYAGNVSDPDTGRFYQTMQEKITAISAEILFFALEINTLDDKDISRKSAAEQTGHYAPWLRDTRTRRAYQLDEALERLLHEKRVAGRAAWNRLFDETMADLRFPFGDDQLTSEQSLHLLSDPDTDVRRRAATSIGETLGQNARVFSLITNTLAKDKEIEDRWREFPSPQSSRNLANHVEDEVVDALVDAVVGSYPRLSHRYYGLKAKWFGVEALDYWDRNAPLPEAGENLIPWDEAQNTVLNAYAEFSDELADVGRKFFENDWIDAPTREGKAGGAFAHPTVPSAHPYLMLNYQGRPRDVMTLAHELGHGVHQVLAGPQGALMSDTPLTLAETASVFGEMLTFRALLANESDPGRRKALLASKVEDMLNTVVRQIAFYCFERKVHDERRGGELSAERLCDIWMEVQGDSLGPAIRFQDEYRWYWTYIPHFIHSPFYVYAYAFGDCLVNSLYAVYQNADQGFVEKYLNLLRAGGTLQHRELLAPFGLNASDPAFWSQGLDIVSGLIDELEALE
jgi:oligoendopeptidase F